MDVLDLTLVLAIVAGVYLITYVLMRKRVRRRTETREDILKQAFHLREKNRDVNLQSLAGALHLAQDRVAEVVAALSQDGLIETRGEQMRLTEKGTEVALSLIRSHRLWERYLADETGIGESRWHEEAEKHEHLLTQEETDALSRRLGHPMYDPHGDPIPQKDLALPGPQGLSLASAGVHEEYIVIHLEDEPAAAFKELVAHQIYRGSRVRMLGKDRTHASMQCDGQEVRIPLFAIGNITVVPARERRPVERTGQTLSDLQEGQHGKVISLSPACRGMQRRRLLDLGILPGTTIVAELESPLGDPMGYRIRGSLVALRRSEASFVNVEMEEV